MIKWAFNAKKGDVSSIFTVDKKHVVAVLEQVRAAGLPEPDVARMVVEHDIILEKKFEILAKKANDAKANSIDELAAKLGKPVSDAAHVSFASPGLF